MPSSRTLAAALLLLLLWGADDANAIPVPVDAVAAAFSHLYLLALQGKAAVLQAEVTAQPQLLNLTNDRNVGLLVAVLTGWQSGIERFPQPLQGDYPGSLHVLLQAGIDASVACPLLDATVQRNLPAFLALRSAMSPSQMMHCLSSADTSGQGVLHAATASCASGFARLIFRLRASSEAAASKSTSSAAVSAAAVALLGHLRLQSPTWSEFEDVSKREIDACSGTFFLEQLLLSATAAGAGGGAAALEGAVNMRDEQGASPLITACRHGLAATVRVLLQWAEQAGQELDGIGPAAVRPASAFGSCVHAAVAGGHVGVLRVLWEHATFAVERGSSAVWRAPLSVPLPVSAAEDAATAPSTPGAPSPLSPPLSPQSLIWGEVFEARDAFNRSALEIARVHGPSHASVLQWLRTTGLLEEAGSSDIPPSVSVNNCPWWNAAQLTQWAAAHRSAGWRALPLATAMRALLEQFGCGGPTSSAGGLVGAHGVTNISDGDPAVAAGGAADDAPGAKHAAPINRRAHPIDVLRVPASSVYATNSSRSKSRRRAWAALRHRLLRDYVSIGKPVLLRPVPQPDGGAEGGGGGAEAFGPALSRSAFLAAFGNLSVEAGAIPYAASYGMEGEAVLGRLTVNEFVARHMRSGGSRDTRVQCPAYGGGTASSSSNSGGGPFLPPPPSVGEVLPDATVSSGGGSGSGGRGPSAARPPYVFDGQVMHRQPERFLRFFPPTDLFVLPTEAELAEAASRTVEPVKIRTPQPTQRTQKRPGRGIQVGNDAWPVHRPSHPSTYTGLHLQQFILGPALSGAMPHFHNAAVNRLVFGLKLWVLFPPAGAEFARVHAHAWFACVYPEKYGCRATDGVAHVAFLQGPGDVVYVPPFWGHAVLNLAESFAIAVE